MESFGSMLAFLLVAAVAADPKDEIVDLPGMSFQPNFKQYSGYLKASETRFLHYWLVESQGNPAKAPLVFWFNGGPGCSSLDGMLAEHGPYLLNDDTSTLRENEYAWNKVANVVYLESPAGVGFSYVTKGDTGVWNDTTTSAESYRAIKHFFSKFPQFRNHSVFVTGESYGGIYVPTLAERIIDGLKEFPLNFEGIAIGNGMLNWELFMSSSVEFQYGHGFIDKPAYKALEACCEGDIIRCDLVEKCKEQHKKAVNNKTEGYYLNMYDIYRDCHVPGMPYNILTSSRTSSKVEVPQGIPNCNPELDPYLNKPDVRTALHIPDHVGTWEFCGLNIVVNYSRTETDMRPQITKLVESDKINDKRAWTIDGLLGGFTTEYEKNLTYITVRGVGHMVPKWQPNGALYFFGQFLKNQPI